MSTTEPVTIIGNGALWDDAYIVTSTPNAALGIICTVAGADLTIQDLYATIGSDDSLVDFVGTDNKLTISGVNLLENEGANSSNAVIHVPSDGDLTIDGDGTLYLYKSALATGIGGDQSETNGVINFNGGTIFVKGTKTGAVIGAGQGACGGDININGGSLYVMGKARGACLGGSGYSGGVVGEGGAVNINGGNVMLVVDWSGAAIGGGGGNASAAEQDGGVVNITGGSLKTRINSNAYGQWGLTAAEDDPGYQISDAAITAEKLNGNGEAVYMLTLPLTDVNANAQGDKYVVSVDGNAYYSGNGYAHTFSADTTSTVANWPVGDTDNSLYLYLTGEDHTVSVNGVDTTYYWDADNSTFSAEKPAAYAWYGDGSAAEYTISTAEELAQLASIVNGTDENYAKDTFLGKTVTLAGDIDLSAVCSEELGSWNAIGGAAENVYLTITSQEELDAALYEYNVIYDDTGWSYKYGTDKNLAYSDARTYYYVSGQIFSGTFDGAGYTIDNLYVLATAGYAGLFGNVDGTLKNFNVTGSVTTATGTTECDFVGGVTGKLSEGGQIVRVTSYVDVDAEEKCYNVGGIAGFNGTKNATAGDDTYVITYTGSTTVAEGGSFSFKVYVEDGYSIASVMANDVVLTASGSTYTIENITSDVTVTITVKTSYAWYEDGTVSGTYSIDTAEELAQFAAIVNGTDANYAQDNFSGKTVTLAADIALAEDGLYTAIENVTYGTSSWPMTVTQYVVSADAPIWTPIGSGTASGNTVSSTANAFAGTFDGAGHTVSGVYTGTADASAANTASVQGLFGIVTGTVKNVTVSGCVTGSSVVGGVVAYLYGGTVENCVNNAIVFSDGGTTPNGGAENGTSRAGATGGIVGLAAGTGSVQGCVNNAAVICANTAKGGRVGGIVGLIDQSTDAISISKCVNNGTVDGYQYVAGIVGMNYAKNSPIDSCVNNGNITFHSGGKSHAGGIVGQFDCIVSNCYNTGDIYATNTVSQEPKYFRGVAGDYVYTIGNGKVINCYTTGTVTYAQSTCSYAGIVLGDGPQSNCYYLDTALANSGSSVVTDINTATKLTEAELKAAAALLGDAFQTNCGGSPVLSWQEANAHTEGEMVVENIHYATCTEDGCYDEVVYCAICAAEISRNTVITPATGHSFDDNQQCDNCGAVTGWSGDLTWILDNGTLTFSGEGKMRAYTYKSETPWYAYREEVTTVVLPEGVTRISGYAFYGMTNLTDIEVPSTVTVIGDYAFKNCAALTEIVLPEGLTTIGDSAFYGTGLTAVEVPASVRVINEYAFKGCASLTTVTLNEGLTVIGEAAFYACPALTEVTLPATVTEIGGYAFKNCSALAAVTLNEGLETIGASAFYGCSALSEIVIPATVTAIEEYAFAHCTALASIDIQGEPVIGGYAFKNVPGYNG